MEAKTKRKEFRRSGLFKVTRPLIGMLVIYGATGGDAEGDILTVVFLGTGLCNASDFY